MATLSDILKNSIAGKELDVEKKLNPLGTVPVQPQQPFQFRPASDYITPQPFKPAGLSLGEYALNEPATTPKPSGAQPPSGLNQFAPAEQQAILKDAAANGIKDFNVDFRQPAVGGVRTPRAASGVTAAPALAAPAATTGADNLAAYMERTGITNVPRAPLEIVGEAGRVNAVNPAQESAFQAYLASPEGQAEQARQAALPNGNLVEVVRGDKTTFENVGGGGVNPALRDYLFSQKQAEQQQRDYLNAVTKQVGAPLTLGEAESLKLGERALQNEGAANVAGINAGAQIGSENIRAAAGKNPLYDLAVADIEATTDPTEKANKLQQYLGRATTAVKDPNVKIFADQLYAPEEQADFAALIAGGTPAARAFALTKQKYGTKE